MNALKVIQVIVANNSMVTVQTGSVSGLCRVSAVQMALEALVYGGLKMLKSEIIKLIKKWIKYITKKVGKILQKMVNWLIECFY